MSGCLRRVRGVETQLGGSDCVIANGGLAQCLTSDGVICVVPVSYGGCEQPKDGT